MVARKRKKKGGNGELPGKAANLTRAQNKRLMKLLASMSVRDRKLMVGLLVHKHQYDALIEAGYTNCSALNPKSIVPASIERNREAMKLLLDRNDIGDETIVRKYKELLDIEVPVAIGRNPKTGEIETVQVADGKTQVRTLELLHKVRGDLDKIDYHRHDGQISVEHTHLIAKEAQRVLSEFNREEVKEIDAEFEVKDD